MLMKKYSQSMYQERQRIKREGYREPLRTLSEMADEFGVKAASLRTLIRYHKGPEPALCSRYKGGTTAVSWYLPSEMRKWWKGVQSS